MSTARKIVLVVVLGVAAALIGSFITDGRAAGASGECDQHAGVGTCTTEPVIYNPNYTG